MWGSRSTRGGSENEGPKEKESRSRIVQVSRERRTRAVGWYGRDGRHEITYLVLTITCNPKSAITSLNEWYIRSYILMAFVKAVYYTFLSERSLVDKQRGERRVCDREEKPAYLRLV
jgi:hypothetical protein